MRQIWKNLVMGVVVWSALAGVAFAETAAVEGVERSGGLVIIPDEGEATAVCPLEHTQVEVHISGFVARTVVTQKFRNPLDQKIEAVYVFPLSADGAVDDMSITVGERVVRGVIKEREEARRIYDQAKRQGYVAGLLDQERPNIFTQSVTNIVAGATVEVRISIVEILKYEAGNYEFVFPMVVGPRYMPGMPLGAPNPTGGWSPDTDQVPDASRISPPVTPPNQRAGHDISLTVHLETGLPLQHVNAVLHDVSVERLSPTRAVVKLSQADQIPNKDFILRYRVVGSEISEAILTHARAAGDGYLTLILAPPEKVDARLVVPKEMLFVIDTSGSMRGWPLDKAKATMRRMIKNMNPYDTFNLVAFANQPRPLFDKPAKNTEQNVRRALQYLDSQMGSGGTEMLSAVDAVLNSPVEDDERVRIVCFMSDGYVGNDFHILGHLQKYIGDTRFFSFGVGNSVNRFLLDKMAEEGRGEVQYVTLNTSSDEAARQFAERIANPVLIDVEVDWGTLAVESVYPKRIPDLYDLHPLVIHARYTEAAEGTITIRGKQAGLQWERTINVVLPAIQPENDVLAPLWARAKIDDLMSTNYHGLQSGNNDIDVKNEIINLGLEYRLLTQYTSFVAVEDSFKTEGGELITIPVPVELPDGVDYEVVFGIPAPQQPTVYSLNTYMAVDRLDQQKISRLPEMSNDEGGAVRHTLGVGTRIRTGRDMDATIEPHQRGVVEETLRFVDDQASVSPKLAPELNNIVDKLDDQGNYQHGSVEVRNGKMVVQIFVQDGTSLDALVKELDGVLKVTRMSENLLQLVGLVAVTDLEKLVQNDAIVKIVPAGR